MRKFVLCMLLCLPLISCSKSEPNEEIRLNHFVYLDSVSIGGVLFEV